MPKQSLPQRHITPVHFVVRVEQVPDGWTVTIGDSDGPGNTEKFPSAVQAYNHVHSQLMMSSEPGVRDTIDVEIVGHHQVKGLSDAFHASSWLRLRLGLPA